MYTFISNDGIKAYSILKSIFVENMDEIDVAVSKCMDGIAMADPISVWGLLNLHKSIGKGIFLSDSVNSVAIAELRLVSFDALISDGSVASAECNVIEFDSFLEIPKCDDGNL